MAKAEERLWLHTTVDHQLSDIKKTEGPITIVYGIKGKCEKPLQETDTERAQISATAKTFE